MLVTQTPNSLGNHVACRTSLAVLIFQIAIVIYRRLQFSKQATPRTLSPLLSSCFDVSKGSRKDRKSSDIGEILIRVSHSTQLACWAFSCIRSQNYNIVAMFVKALINDLQVSCTHHWLPKKRNGKLLKGLAISAITMI